MLTDYEHLATGRRHSVFSDDIDSHRNLLSENIRGSRVAVIGAAGSIGFSVVKMFLEFCPKTLVLIDLSENNLVEVVRELRSSDSIVVPEEFLALPIGLGSVECARFFSDSRPFDYIVNLCAIKHVRSEKDIYSLSRMIDTNILFINDLLEDLRYDLRKFFSVSSDKAANPANLMGASKMVMEEMLCCKSQPFSTARFANVAFSDGSLPYGFLRRIENRQPLSAPNDMRRYFMSHEEAGQICVLSCVLGEYADVFFPNLKVGLDTKMFPEIAVGLLAQLGYEPVNCDSEDEAKARAEELIPKKKWPCHFFTSDTTGEKAFEEFYTEEEILDLSRFQNIGVIKRSPAEESRIREFEDFMVFAKAARLDSHVKKTDYVRAFEKIVPSLEHIEQGKNLDQKM